MDKAYLGTLERTDPLHEYLETFVEVDEPVFEAYSLHPEHLMVRYAERTSGAQLACKFYARKLPVHTEPTDDYFRERLHEELDLMKAMRSLGFDRPPYRVPQPLGVNEDLEFLLVEEFVDGPHLDDFMKGAFRAGRHAELQERLRDLGHFLQLLHLRSRHGQADPEPALGFVTEMLGEVGNPFEVDRETWRLFLAEAPAVLMHGDSTPMNYVFPAPGEVVALDLERCARGDGMQDIGSLQAELFTAGLEEARPHLEALRAAYLDGEPEEHSEERRRFWTGAYLLRIARNDWIEEDKRALIVKEARQCLKL